MSQAQELIEQRQAVDALVRAKCRKQYNEHGTAPNPYLPHTPERTIWNDEVRVITHEIVQRDRATYRRHRA